jgi:phosphoglucosamine mutase
LSKLFGTDGIRGVANVDLTPELALRIGRAAALALAKGGDDKRPQVVIGRDTRASGQMLEGALIAGLTSAGVDVLLAGVIPTPGVAFLTRRLQLSAGVVISASHNPIEDNGIKFFDGQGLKPPDEKEEEIERLIEKDDFPRPVAGEVGRVYSLNNALELYGEFLVGTIEGDLSGLRVVLDCGHGAAYQVAPMVLERLGAEVIVLNNRPNGANINVDCGSTHPEVVQRVVLKEGASIGLSHDGDADRVIAVDELGNIVDGDSILAMCGLDLLSRGRLPGKAIAATVYSNMALRDLFAKAGGSVVITKAGDRHVLEAMQAHGLILGGEQSGHIIFLEQNTTGDGILTALNILALMKRKQAPLSKLTGVMEPYPQILVNVRVKNKEGLKGNGAIADRIREAEERLSPNGRLFVRPSGTEPVIRVMGEGPEEELVKDVVEDLAGYIGGTLN